MPICKPLSAMKNMTRTVFLVLFLLLSLDGFAQQDTSWVVDRVIGVEWFRTNQHTIDSLESANPHSYDPPHGGATELTFKLDKNEFGILITGRILEMDICNSSLHVNNRFFKVTTLECSRSGDYLPKFIYGFINDNQLNVAFSDLDLNIDENLKNEISSNETSNWIVLNPR